MPVTATRRRGQPEAAWVVRRPQGNPRGGDRHSTSQPARAHSIGGVANSQGSQGGPGGKPARRQPRGQGSGIVVARPFGIPVHISPYWFVIAGIFILLYAHD